MPKLSFHARPGLVCHWPGPKAAGQVSHYIGRTTRVIDGVIVHEPNAEPVVVDANTPEGRRAAELCRRDGALWPADEATARHCGQPYTELERDDVGEWVPRRTARAASVARTPKHLE